MGKVLIAGVDSMIGANLALALSRQFDCVGLYHQTHVAPDGCAAQACDLSRPADVVQSIRTAAPDWVVYCPTLASSSWEPVGDDPSLDHEAELARQIADATAAISCALTVVSTDAVYAGPRLFHEEASRPSGQTPLARSARRMEELLHGTHALVARTHAYGWGPCEDRPSFVESIACGLLEGTALALDGVRYATPILVSDLAELLLKAYEHKLQGLYHITGAERTNIYRFATALAAALGIESGRWTGGTSHADAAANSTPVLETSLNTRRARRDLVRPMPLLREGLERFAAQQASGYLDALRAGTHQPIAAAQAA